MRQQSACQELRNQRTDFTTAPQCDWWNMDGKSCGRHDRYTLRVSDSEIFQWRKWRNGWHDLRRSLINKGQGHSFWYQSIPHIRLPIRYDAIEEFNQIYYGLTLTGKLSIQLNLAHVARKKYIKKKKLKQTNASAPLIQYRLRSVKAVRKKSYRLLIVTFALGCSFSYNIHASDKTEWQLTDRRSTVV